MRALKEKSLCTGSTGNIRREQGVRTVNEARRLLFMGSICAFLSVAIGAFGAHALKSKLEQVGMPAVYETGVHYQMFHSAALLLLAAFASNGLIPAAKAEKAGVCMLVGIVLFSGSLYLLAISGIKVLGAITPFGGLAFMLAWLMLAAAALKKEQG